MPDVPEDRRKFRPALRRRIARGALAVFMTAMGVLHFTSAEFFVRAMPPYLPWHLGLVYLSGVFEIAGGLGLLVPRVRVAAAWGLVALLVAVFPANIHMAVHGYDDVAPALLWARLPLQPLLIAWAYVLTRPDPPAR